MVSFSFLFHTCLYCPNASLLECFEWFYFPVRKKMYIYWWCLKTSPLLFNPTVAILIFHKLMPTLLQECPKFPIITSMLNFVLYILFFLKYHFTMLLSFSKSEVYPLFSSEIPPIYAGLVHSLPTCTLLHSSSSNAPIHNDCFYSVTFYKKHRPRL